MSDDSRPSDRSDRSIQLFVGRLPIDTDIKEVEDRFSKYGQMSRCDLKRGNRMAYAFVKFEDKHEAEDAMKCENKTDFNGSEIVIEWSNDSKGGGRGGRGGRGGGFRGRGGRGRYDDDDGYRGGGRDYGGDYRGSYRNRDDRRDDYGSRGRSHYDDDYSSGHRSRSRERY